MIPKAEFGRTGHKSSRVIFGAASLGHVSQKVADQSLDVLLRYGVNHIDTASGYGDSELRIAPWLKREPKRFFLATKGDKRDEKGAREEIQRSLDRLEVDHVDLWQIHALADPIEWDQALSPGGALVRPNGFSRPSLGAIGLGQTLGDPRRLRINPPHLLQAPLRHFQITLTSLIKILRVLWRQLAQGSILVHGGCEVVRAFVSFSQFHARQRLFRVELDRTLEFPDGLRHVIRGQEARPQQDVWRRVIRV